MSNISFSGDVLGDTDDNNYRFLIGTNVTDGLVGSSQNDYMDGRGGNDVLFGYGGNDVLIGGGGRDIMYGGAGNDVLIGGTGSDILFGHLDNDVLVGGAGNDWMHGGAGNDTMTGGAGTDTFVYDNVSAIGFDIITDFVIGEDKIDVSALNVPGAATAAGFSSAAAFLLTYAAQDGNDVIFSDAGGGWEVRFKDLMPQVTEYYNTTGDSLDIINEAFVF